MWVSLNTTQARITKTQIGAAMRWPNEPTEPIMYIHTSWTSGGSSDNRQNLLNYIFWPPPLE